MSYGAWPPPVRALANALDGAIAAARAQSVPELDEQLALLDRVEPEVVAVLLGDVLRALVERTYPDGLDAADAEELIDACRAASAPFEPDDDALVVALMGALGIGIADDGPRPGGAVVRHGVLVIAFLLSVGGLRAAPLVEAALRELQRAQTVELP